MDAYYRERIADLIDRQDQARWKNEIAELRNDPRKFARTTIFAEDANQNQRLFDAGTDKAGNEIRFGYTVGRNLAGFFLSFTEITTAVADDRWEVNYESFQPHTKRKNAKRVSAKRADEALEKNGHKKRWSRFY